MLYREFTVSAPKQVWCGDTTGSGSLAHLYAMIDLFARRVVGRAFSWKPDADLVIKALDMV